MTSPPPAPFARKDLIAAFAVILIWAMNFVALKKGLNSFTPLQLAAARFILSAFPMVLLIRPPTVGLRWVMGYGLLQGVGQFGLLTLALKVGMTAALAPVVMQMQVFVTAVLGAILLGETLGRPLKTGLAIAALGLSCLAINALTPESSGTVTLAGILLTLLAASSWAGSNIVVRKLQARGIPYKPLSLVVWSSVTSALCLTALSLLLDAPADRWHWTEAPWDVWLWVIYVSWIGNVVSFGLWASLLARYAANRVAPFSFGVPVLGILAGTLILHETVTVWQWIGGSLVMLALLVVVRGGNSTRRP
jgi:O-acetylserine/cysteine efflux transporter